MREPLLGSIPLFGRLFSSSKELHSTTELMLVVSPLITRALPPGEKPELPNSNPDEGE